MSSVRVFWGGIGNESGVVAGILSDESAASSYGAPVIVGPGGGALGPGDLGGRTLTPPATLTAEERALLHRAQAAGFAVWWAAVL